MGSHGPAERKIKMSPIPHEESEFASREISFLIFGERHRVSLLVNVTKFAPLDEPRHQ